MILINNFTKFLFHGDSMFSWFSPILYFPGPPGTLLGITQPFLANFDEIQRGSSRDYYLSTVHEKSYGAYLSILIFSVENEYCYQLPRRRKWSEVS